MGGEAGRTDMLPRRSKIGASASLAFGEPRIKLHGIDRGNPSGPRSLCMVNVSV
jgi:hypothetical protein